MSLTAHAAFAILEALRRTALPEVLDEFDGLRGDKDILDRLILRLKRAAAHDYNLGRDYVVLLSRVVASVGPRLRDMSPEKMETEVAAAGSGAASIVMPRWVLSSPIQGALMRRMPCHPLIESEDQDLAQAYRGLLHHLEFVGGLRDEGERHEMLHTAIPWRIVAIVDNLEPKLSEKDPIATRIGRLKGRTVGGRTGSCVEMGWWTELDAALCSRRHALSHLGPSEGWTFSRCVQAIWTMNEARAATAGIGLAVLDTVFRDLRDAPPDAALLASVLSDKETSWLDEYEGA